jgi:crotonobetainyl-CoA:carnitine CoA-transferase CaiB-like acyl-CoA transferase
MLATVEHSLLGEVKMPAVVPRLSESPGEITWPGRDLGADTDAVLTRALGYTPSHLKYLHARGVI